MSTGAINNNTSIFPNMPYRFYVSNVGVSGKAAFPLKRLKCGPSRERSTAAYSSPPEPLRNFSNWWEADLSPDRLR